MSSYLEGDAEIVADVPTITVRDGVRYTIRDFVYKTDVPFVFHSWCNQIRKERPFAQMRSPEFREYKTNVLERLVDRLGRASGILIACHPEDHNLIRGYAVAEVGQDQENILHFAYTRNTWRHFGIATMLLTKLLPKFGKGPIIYTHQTPAMRGYLAKRWQATFNHGKATTGV